MSQTLLSNALRHAVRLQMIQFNPAANIPKAKSREKEIQILPAEKCKKFLSAAKSRRLHALCRTRMGHLQVWRKSCSSDMPGKGGRLEGDWASTGIALRSGAEPCWPERVDPGHILLQIRKALALFRMDSSNYEENSGHRPSFEDILES